jgi:hypothetical protein
MLFAFLVTSFVEKLSILMSKHYWNGHLSFELDHFPELADVNLSM